MFEVEKIRRDFPILSRTVRGKPLVYLDNAATSQKPQVVIDAVTRFYTETCANIHRGVHQLSEEATAAYEDARRKVAKFLNAGSAEEIIFVRGATEAINLVAASDLRPRLSAGDEILITHMEHHANIVPWQLAAEACGAKIRVLPVTESGDLDLSALADHLTPRTRLLSVTQLSNALGTVNPVAELIQAAHAKKIPVLIDGAQALPHLRVDVRALDCDFYVFSGHKLFGPTGIGVLYGKRAHLEAMPPYQGGGDMIKSVSFEKTLYNDIPYKFEAGTPHIAGVMGLGAAIDYLSALDWKAAALYEDELVQLAEAALRKIPGLRQIGCPKERKGILSFVLDGVHPHDVGTILDREGVAVRAGHHCAQPLMEFFKVPATVRASFAFYNTREEVAVLVRAIQKVVEMFRS